MVPFGAKLANIFDGIHFGALPASEGRIVAKVEFLLFLRQIRRHGLSHHVGAGNALFLGIAVHGLDLFLGKINDGPHDDIVA